MPVKREMNFSSKQNCILYIIYYEYLTKKYYIYLLNHSKYSFAEDIEVFRVQKALKEGGCVNYPWG